MPTATASYYLGELALQEQRYEQAQSYFQQAAQEGGELGIQSREKIQQLNLQLRPHTFLAFGQSASSKGALLINVMNTSPRGMSNIIIEVFGPTNLSGSGQAKIIELTNVLEPGEQVTISTGLAYFLEQQGVANYRIVARSAKLVN